VDSRPADLTLADLGFSPRLSAAQAEPAHAGTVPVRVLGVHRTVWDVAGAGFTARLPRTPPGDDPLAEPTVGDWLAVDPDTGRVRALYPRTSLFRRLRAGRGRRVQLIAADVDTVFLVTSADEDFSEARLERYLAVAHEAGAWPVIVITKADLAADVAGLVARARALDPAADVEAVDARTPGLPVLAPHLGRGRTVALLGSSGVGKSTIVNSLLGESRQQTGAVRAADARGRHTTTARTLHRLPSGAWLIDTPGMRALGLVEADAGLQAVFEDVAELAARCRFPDCRHEDEPGCAVRAAVAAGDLPAERVDRFFKLEREERHNSEQVHEAHARDRAFGRMARQVLAAKNRQR